MIASKYNLDVTAMNALDIPTRRILLFPLAALVLSMLLLGRAASPAAATVIMQLGDLPGSQQFQGNIDATGSTPIEAMDSVGGGFAHGRVTYTGLGLHASQMESGSAGETNFTVFARLRYDDLQITSDDLASSVSGFVNLVLDGSSVIDSSDPDATRAGYTINPLVSTASGGNAGSSSRVLWIFGDQYDSSGFLTGYTGNGPIAVSVPVVFSTTATEFLQIELRIAVDAFNSESQSASVDVDFLDTLRFADPGQLVTFTSGLNPTLNSTTGEIVDNQIVVPEPSALALAVTATLGAAGFARRRRHRLRAKDTSTNRSQEGADLRRNVIVLGAMSSFPSAAPADLRRQQNPSIRGMR